MPRHTPSVTTISTQHLLEQYVDEAYLATHHFHPKMEDFYIARLEDFHAALQLPTKPHRRHVHIMVFVTAGVMTVTCDLQRIRIGADEAHLALADQVVVLESMSEDIRGFYWHFSLEAIVQIYHREHMLDQLAALSEGMRTGAVALRGTARATVAATLNRLHDEHAGANDLRLIDAYLVTLCYELKAVMAQRSAPAASSRALEVTEAFKRLAHEHAREQRPLPFYAERLGISANHLNKCVRQATGQAASAVLADAVMLEAKLLLRHAGLSVAEIAYQLGFSDPAYFSRIFRARTGRAPREYRAGNGGGD